MTKTKFSYHRWVATRVRPFMALVAFSVAVWLAPHVISPIARLLLTVWNAAGLPLGPRVPHEIAPAGLIAGTFVYTIMMLVLSVFAALIAGRSLKDFRLTPILPKQAALGFFIGFGSVALLLSVLAILGMLQIAPSGRPWTWQIAYLFFWFVGMCLVGAGEELSARGATLSLLSELTTPWAACIITALFFGAEHFANPGETVIGIIQTMAFGLVTAFSVIRTGSIWWAVGLHAGWDWALENVFGATGSGLQFQGSLLVSTPHGSAWLTGGAAGPEGSILSLVVLAVAGLYVVMLRARPVASTIYADALSEPVPDAAVAVV